MRRPLPRRTSTSRARRRRCSPSRRGRPGRQRPSCRATVDSAAVVPLAAVSAAVVPVAAGSAAVACPPTGRSRPRAGPTTARSRSSSATSRRPRRSWPRPARRAASRSRRDDIIPNSLQEAQVLKAQLAEAGMTMDIQIVDGAQAAGRDGRQDLRLDHLRGAGGPTRTATPSSTSTRGPACTNGRQQQPEGRRTARATSEATDQAERKKIYFRLDADLKDEAAAVFWCTRRAEGAQPEGPGLPADPGRDDAVQGRLAEVACDRRWAT